MYTENVSRRKFLDIVQRSQPGSLRAKVQEETFPELSGPEINIVWGNDTPIRDQDLPAVLIIPRNSQRDFFAWAYTYVSALRPLTAFIRVVDSTLIPILETGSVRPSLGRLSEAFVAMIIGEAISYLEPTLDGKQLTSNACSNTHSYALTRAVSLGFERYMDDVSSAWHSVGEITRQARRNFDVRLLGAPFQVIYHLQNVQRFAGPPLGPSLETIRDACKELLTDGDIQPQTWRQLTNSFAGISDLKEQMQQSRENRVRLFEKARDSFMTNRQGDPILYGFICGYLCSRVAPGTLDHFHLVSKMLPSLPTAVLWFSLCAGLQSHGQVLAFSDGLGRRILRDLEQLENPIARPRCDLALPELDILLNRDKPLTDFRTASNGQLTVELFPCITTNVRWQRTTESQADLFERRESSLETRELVRELSLALERVELIRRQLARQVNIDSGHPTEDRGDKKSKRR